MILPTAGPSSPAVPTTPHRSKNPLEKTRLLESGPLADVLNRVLVHVDDLRPLITAADEVGFDTFSQIFWPCISTSIVDNLDNTIFAAGRPDDLHKVCSLRMGIIARSCVRRTLISCYSTTQ